MTTYRYALAVAEPIHKLGDETKNDAGAAVQRFRKQVARPGTFRHPTKGWTLVLTPDRLRKYVDRFKTMSTNKIGVPLCEDHVVSARTNKGFVKAMEVDDDGNLFAEFEAIGRDAIEMVARNDASVCIEPDAKDGEGRSYGEAITHIGLTPTPVIGGMSPAATAAGLTTPLVYRYATEETDGEDSKPDPQNLDHEGTNMDLKSLANVLGIEGELSEDDALDKIKAHIESERESATADKDRLTALQAKVEELEANGGEPKIDPDTAEDRAELIEERLDGLVEKGNVTPAVAASLKTELCGQPGARPAYTLSRTSDSKKPLARRLIDILSANDPKTLTEKTGAQAGRLALSRDTVAEGADDSWVDKSIEKMNAKIGEADGGFAL